MSKKTSIRKFTAENLRARSKGNVIIRLLLMNNNRVTIYQSNKQSPD